MWIGHRKEIHIINLVDKIKLSFIMIVLTWFKVYYLSYKPDGKKV